MTDRSKRNLRVIKSCFLAFTALSAAGGTGAFAAAAHAQGDGAQGQAFDFDLPAQALSQSVLQIGSIGKVQVLYSDDSAPRVMAPALKGRMTVDQALTRLLAGTGYVYEYTRPGVITLRKVSAEGNGADGEKVTAAVNVEGYQGSPYFGGAGVAAGVNGINGSRDITATEGTGSFTSGALTIGSKVPQALKDVPQSISVLTNERLEQQNVTDFTTAMKQLPGISLAQGDTNLDSTFYSRGFAITSIQVDGGAPFSTVYGAGSGNAYFPFIDMAQYDHVELLRGAAGLLNGYGNPSGTINLVRKKPLDHGQVVTEAQAGSWSNYRLMLDASAPLALGGKLRGRLVTTYQDNRHFYDVAKDNKTLIYGIAEMDVTPSTLVTAGISYTRQDSVPWANGMPRFQNGHALDLPRSTALAFPWNRWNFDTTEIFSSIEQKIGGDWTAKFNLTRNRQQSAQKIGLYRTGAGVDPDDYSGPLLVGTYADYASEQFAAEATLSGSFELFGQRQEVTLGANRVNSDASGQTSYLDLITSSSSVPYQPYPGGPKFCTNTTVCPSGQRTPPINVFDFDPNDPLYTEPRNPLPNYRYPTNGQIQYGSYINFRLTALDRLHLTTGLRWSHFESKFESQSLCTSIPASDPGTTPTCFGHQIGDAYTGNSAHYGDDDISWPPPASLSFDVTKSLNAYVGYTDIYISQAGSLDGDQQSIDPITGSNIEAGLKWSARDGRFNASLAAYRIKQKGFAASDNDGRLDYTDIDPAAGIYYYVVDNAGNRIPNGQVAPAVSCCYVSNPDQTFMSRGFDLDITGELLPGLQLAASYSYSETKQEGSYFGTKEGLPFLSIQPKHNYKLWVSYDFGEAGQEGALGGLAISAGVNGQSAGFRSGKACPGGYYAPYSFAPDYLVCEGAEEPYSFTVAPYAVVSGRIDYRFSDRWSLGLNLENILDKTYYQSVGASLNLGNWYGAPRSFTATLRAKW